MAFKDGYEGHIPQDFGVYWGSVTQNADPDKLGRVRVYVPGRLEPESPWAWPVGMPGAGSEQQGWYAIPRLNSTVLVGFIQGDENELFYMAGPHRIKGAKSGIPRMAEPESAAEAPNVRAFETETFEIVIKDTADDKRLFIRSKGDASGGEIEFDANDRSVVVRGDTTLILESNGIIDIRATRVQIQGRVVKPVGNPI